MAGQMINRQCQECGGYELDNGVDDVCDCEEVVGCANGCGEEVTFGGFCSMVCKQEWEAERGEDYGQ